MTKVNKDNGLSTLRRTPLPLKSERCFCTASEHRDQKFPPVFPVPSTEALPDLSPVAAPPIAQLGLPVKGIAAATRRCFAPLTGCPGCATSQGATGDISSRAAPFPCPGKGRGDRVERFPLKPLFSLLICGQLTISKSCPARVSNSGFVGAGIVSFPRLDLSKCCQHFFGDWNSK